MCCGWLAYRCVGSTILFIASTEHIVQKSISTRKKSVMQSRTRFPAKSCLSLELSRNRLSSQISVMNDLVRAISEISSVSVMILSLFVTHWGNQSEKCHFALIIKEPTPLMALIFTLTETDHSLGKSHLNLLYHYMLRVLAGAGVASHCYHLGEQFYLSRILILILLGIIIVGTGIQSMSILAGPEILIVLGDIGIQAISGSLLVNIYLLSLLDTSLIILGPSIRPPEYC
jgi:hypothetical protein